MEHALAKERRGDPERELSTIREDEAQFASGAAARWSHGVEYCGPHETAYDGTNVAVRRHARALAQAGVPVLLTSPTGRTVVDGVARPVYEVGLPDEVELECGALRSTSMAVRAVRIIHAVVVRAEQLERMILPMSVMSGVDAELIDGLLRRTIAYTVWERDRIHPEIARVLNQTVEAWVPCRQNRDMLRSCGVERVRVVPHPFDPQGTIAKLVRRRPVSATKRFYSIGQWQPRKGGFELLVAFFHAFTPADDVLLTIKTGQSVWTDYPAPQAALEEALQTNQARANGWTRQLAQQKVRIIDRYLNESQLVKLHYENNIYVSPGHGEAWCLPAFDAVTAGNRLVHVPYGGTADFAQPGDVAVPFELEPVPDSYGWEADAQWAGYQIRDLAAALRAVEAPTKYERTTDFEQRFSMAAVGEQMREAMLGLVLADEAARAVLEERHQVPIQGSVLEKPERPEVQELVPHVVRLPAALSRNRLQRVWGAIQRLIRR